MLAALVLNLGRVETRYVEIRWQQSIIGWIHHRPDRRMARRKTFLVAAATAVSPTSSSAFSAPSSAVGSL